MFQRIKQRIRDVKTIHALCTRAEWHALQEGLQEPGAEHFLLSSLDLPDGTARRALARCDVDPDKVREAMLRQHEDALRSVGLDAASLKQIHASAKPVPARTGVYKASPSGQAVMQGLTRQRQADRDAPLVGAHVLAVVAGMEQGVAARTLRAMGVSTPALTRAVEDELRQASR